MQYAQGIAAGVEVEPQREREPAARAVGMFAFEPDYRANRTPLLDGDFRKQPLELFLAHLRIIRRCRTILPQ